MQNDPLWVPPVLIPKYPQEFQIFLKTILQNAGNGLAVHWEQLLQNLPDHYLEKAIYDQEYIQSIHSWDQPKVDQVRKILEALKPWRKGPFRVGPITIDTEWNSHQKWSRLEKIYPLLKGAKILDIGCSSGYYMFRMLAHQPEWVWGIDPSFLFFSQFKAIQKLTQAPRIYFSPVGMDDLSFLKNEFDVIFCMGILYHRRSPHDALRSIRELLKPGGILILETITYPGEQSYAFTPKDRYAGMKNVYHLPTVVCLENWLTQCKYTQITHLNTSPTTLNEQRKTEWIDSHSLNDFLDPENPTQTIEGYPAPQRSVLTAMKKGS